MNCYTSGIIGLGFLIASYSTMSVSVAEKQLFKKKLSPSLIKIYDEITSERRNQYIQGLILGLIISYIFLIFGKTNNKYHNLVFSLAITVATSVIYYFLTPKSDYMLNHLKTHKHNKAWLKIYSVMKKRYLLGFLLGSFSSLPISYVFC